MYECSWFFRKEVFYNFKNDIRVAHEVMRILEVFYDASNQVV